MRLKCIKLAGFKSFVDPTRIDFPGNLTAVVGPNGCGKSNVIDAVRWVMGESSARHLRGQAMTDVIFNGSSQRKPVGQCSVELQFDNSKHTLVGPYADYNEISVRRKVTRDGQSTYYLNGSKCRRRDVTDLFAGTGLGPRSYAIIEQGMISRLIEARPEELRVYLEEAAGISRYKDRRRETENRMRRTQDNLERLQDIQSELTRQLAHLQRQARTAETYQTLKQEERVTRARLMALRWRDYDLELREARQALAQAQRDEEGARAELRQGEADLESLRLDEETAREDFQGTQKAYYEAGNRIARLEQQAAHQQDRISQLRLEAGRLEQEKKAFHEETGQDRDQYEELTQSLAGVREEMAMAEVTREEADAALADAQADFDAAEQLWLERNDGSVRIAGEMAQWRTQLEQSGQQMQQLRARRERLQADLENASTDPAASEIQRLEENLEILQARLDSQEEAATEADENLRSERAAQQQRQETLQEKQAGVHRDQQELVRLQAALETQSGSAERLDDWLRRWQWQDAPVLIDSIQADAPWQNPLEWVLGAWLQSRVLPVDDLPEAAWEGLPDSRMAWLFAAASESTPQVPAGSLAARVRAPAGLQSWLARIQCADTEAQAQARRLELQPGQSVICPQGLWLGPDWVRVFRSDDDRKGQLARREEMAELGERLDDAEFELEDLTLNQEAARQALEQAERDLASRRAQCEDTRGQVHALERDLSARRATDQALSEKLERMRSDLEETDSSLNAARQSYDQAQSELGRLDEAQAREDDNEQARAALDATRIGLEDARAAAQQAREQEQNIALRRHGLETRREGMQSQIDRSQERAVQVNRRVEEVAEALAELDTPDDDLAGELSAAIDSQRNLEKELSERRNQAERLATERTRAEHLRSTVESRLQAAQASVSERNLVLERVRTRQAGMEEQLQEQQFDLPTLLDQLAEEDTTRDCEARIETLVERIRKLGPINLAAIDEYAVQQERQSYLERQQADLERALETLTQAIARIDQETRSRFRETFDRVNAGLQELFPQMFGGGHAYLDLTGDDLLSTGVAIMARPPGKKNATIHLLSGGEKALTAIALVFSIFRLNPSPFCMLDEVDAPLDDANVLRYSRLVEAMSDQVEFIFITHNKVAMEIAERLLGVTMSEPGVSRLVSVNVDEAVEMATQ